MSARGGLSETKWHLPGWRIEQKYSNGVLIGNWFEDRLGKVRSLCACATLLSVKFHRGSEFGNSTHREAFRTYNSHCYRPDVSTRRMGLLRSDVSVAGCVLTASHRRVQ